MELGPEQRIIGPVMAEMTSFFRRGIWNRHGGLGVID